jgi:dTDP-4-dehydrorhamnose reductase
MRVLVLGGTGMLGHKLAQVFGADARLDVHATVRRSPPAAFTMQGVTYHEGVEIGPNPTRLRAVIEELAPDVIVNAIGWIKQNKVAGQLEPAFWINGIFPHLLTYFNPNRRSRVIHFSTDCVFRGDRGHYTEAEKPDALDVYGRSKACGEIDYGRHLTVRTSIIGFEFRGHLGLLSWLLSRPRGSSAPGFERAIFSGLPTRTLASTVLSLIVGRGAPELSGLYHVASQPINKFELLQRVNRALMLDLTLRPDASLVLDRSLSDAKFREATHTSTPAWDSQVAALVHDYQSLPYHSIYETLRQS